MNKKLVRLATPPLVLVAGLGVYALLHAHKPEPEKRDEAPRPVSVFVERVEPADVNLEITTEGEVRSRIAIDLVAQVSGRITAVSREFMEGGSFTPDSTLISIEDTDYRLALSQAEAQVAQATVGVELALADADVARKQLRNTPNPSPLALKKPQVAEAQALLKAAEADLEQARINLQRTAVSLPFEGRIAKTYVDLGQYVTAGAPLAQVFATDTVEVRLPISYEQLAALALPIGYVAEPGQGPAVEFSADLAGVKQIWHGQLVRLDAGIDSSTRLLYAVAEVRDPYGANRSQFDMPLAVGLYVEATIKGRQIENAVQIPPGTLRAGDTVYVLNDRGNLDIRKVTVTHSSPAGAVIKDGVRAGELVITSTLRNPIPGMALQAGSDEASGLVKADKASSGPG